MRRSTRSERIKQHRATRMKRAADIIEGNVPAVDMRIVRRNQVILYAVAILMAICYIQNIRHAPTFEFGKDEFKARYELFVKDNKESFSYDKTLENIIKSKTEYTFLQKCSMDTGSLVAIYEQGMINHRIRRVGIVGKLNNKDYFSNAYAENMALVVGLLFQKTYSESMDILKNMNILDENYKIIYREKKFIVKYNNVEVDFFTDNDKVIFSIESK